MPVRTVLSKLGLNRPELRAWAMYDWANSVFMTTVLMIFPLYFVGVAAKGMEETHARTLFAYATSVSVVLVGIIGPILGAVADFKGNKKGFLAAFLTLGVTATGALFLVREGDASLALTLFIVGNIGVTSTLAFYNALLPGIAGPEEMDRVSTAGFALGYLGGGLLLGANLFMLADPTRFGLPDSGTASRIAFLSAAVWWAVFSLPLFFRVKEPVRQLEAGEAPKGSTVVIAVKRLKETVTELKHHKDAGLMLLAFLVFNDAINTIIRMATTFGDELKIPQPMLIAAILMVQFVGVPFAFLFGGLADRFGAKRTIFISLAVYAGITVLAWTVHDTKTFFLIAFLVGTVQGGAQALSRSLFATLIPKHKAGEMFGFFGVFDRFGGAFGSAVYGYVLSVTGSSRPALFSLLAFFIVGAFLLSRVNVERGRKAARDAEAQLTTVASAQAAQAPA